MTCLCNGLEIGMGHFLCVILFEDIDKVVSEGIKLRSCICSQILQVTCLCIGLEIRLGHFPCFFFHFYLYDEKPKYWDFELDWGISEVMHIFKNI